MVTGMLFKKETKTSTPRPSRIQKMETAQLRMWLNTCLMELGHAYDNYVHHDADPKEFAQILDLVKNLWDELQSRSLHD